MLNHVRVNFLNHLDHLRLGAGRFISAVEATCGSLLHDFLILALNFEHLQVLLLHVDPLIIHFNQFHFVQLVFLVCWLHRCTVESGLLFYCCR